MEEAYRIEPVGSTSTVCQYSPVPQGWFDVSGIHSDFGQCNGWEFQISQSNDGICDLKNVPPGYVVVSVEANGCGNGRDRYQIAEASDGTAACFWSAFPVDATHMPTNFVTTTLNTTSSSICPNGVTYNLRQPVDGLQVCADGTPVNPEGFQRINPLSSTPSCTDSPNANPAAFSLRLISGGGGSGSVPAEFVSPEPNITVRPAPPVPLCEADNNTLLINGMSRNTGSCTN